VALQKPLDQGERHRMSLGANIQNAIEPRLRLLTEDVEDPRSLRLGVGYEGANRDGEFAWAVGTDMVVAKKADWTAGVGSELTYAQALSLRFGLDGRNPTFGMGVQWRQVRFDYALRTDDTLPRNDRFTLAVHFGTSVQQRRQDRLHAQNRLVTDQLAQLLVEREAAEVQRAFLAAETAFSEAQWHEALRLYRKVLALDPTHARAQQQSDSLDISLQLAEADDLMASNQPALAAGLYQSILTSWPHETRAQTRLEQARTALQASADRDEALRQLFKDAFDQFADGNYLNAQASLRELLRVDPHFALGLDLQERVTQAIRKRGEGILREAQLLAATENYEAALRKLHEARELLEDRAYLNELESTWEQSRIAAQRNALQLAEKKKSRGATPVTEDTTPRTPQRLTPEQRRDLQRKYQDGLAAFTRGDFDEATRNWRAVWFDAPNYENVRSYLIKAYLFQGVELYGRGQYDAALDRCKSVLEIDPTNEKALRYLDRIQEEKLEIEAIERGKSNE
jgi:tetratricopeptide (TPR) repeat protein